MKILKRENSWVWLLLFLFSSGSSTLVLGALLDVYNRDAWYAKWQYWVMGLLFFIFPFFIMLVIFNIQIIALTAAKLDVSGKEIYLSPYIWILCVIIPVFGWIFVLVMYLYLQIFTIIKLYQGEGEKYIM
ncbi:MAG: hypothetical protein GX247_02670 [Mollicutes bacterium]|nr:hypothetical protein [Mollicutes bacterium]